MIKRLKRRFLFVNMSILTCVLLSILISVFALMYSSEIKLSYEIMESLMFQKEDEHNQTLSHAIIDESIIDVDLMSNTYNNNDMYFHENQWGDKKEPVHTSSVENIFDDQHFDDNHQNDMFFPPENPEFIEPNVPDNDNKDDVFSPPENPESMNPDVSPKPDEPSITTVPSPATEKTVTTVITSGNKDKEKNNNKKTDIKTTNKKILPTNPPTNPNTSTSEKTTVTKPSFNSDTPDSDNSSSAENSKTNLKPPPINDTSKGTPPPDPFKGKVQRSYVYVEFEDIDNIDSAVYQYLTTENEEEVKKAVDQIYENNKEQGKITIGANKYRYMYRYNPIDSSYSIVMLDRTLEINTINRLFFIFIVIAVVGLILIFFISLLLANWTIKPVEKAWTQQKEFIANASHELKTPLTVISTNTDVVLSYPDDTINSQAKWLNYIKNETVRMSKLVNNLLCIAKYDAKRIETTQENMDLSKTVSSICLQYEPLAFENKKTLITDIDDNLKILGDEDKIKQVVNILMDNALKYSLPEGTIKVSLKKIKQTSPCLTVSNSSENISQEQLDKIFDRFYRVDSSRNRKTGGSGLGLNIAKTIVENHKGTINVVNKDNITSFIVTF